MMIEVLETGIEEDLAGFSAFLWRQGIRHRITEGAGRQQLWVTDEESGRVVLQYYQQLREGRLVVIRHAPAATWPNAGAWFAGVRALCVRAPVCCVLLLTCLAFFPLTLGYEENRLSDLLHWFTFTDFRLRGQYILFATIGDTLRNGEIWRLWTPIFIHFGILHLVFNLAMMWVCGQRMESAQGPLLLIGVTLLSALASNFAQYAMSGPGLFGGMSGVIYGYLGYCFIWSRLRPQHSFGLPTGIYVFMLVWLALGFSGVFDLFLTGSMANGAHLGGLIAGLALGLLAARFLKTPPARTGFPPGLGE